MGFSMALDEVARPSMVSKGSYYRFQGVKESYYCSRDVAKL
ncbi:hypothetical protein E2C01_004493 [Portunus trituberculatus]|uniref:Uncharacterized protein n=1 Tax=Portunus trituberculatus TaxID=210409 RepID=A0A5B7CRX3_PORTR|nr:hypothetical protein [Portunus trituberculatus]